MKAPSILLLASCLLSATNYTVKAGGGGSFTTMAACASQMSTNGTSVSDTCTVFAGTYAETVTIPSGSTGNYKIFNVNGSDVVNVLGFTAASHTKIIGFQISNTSSPGSHACVELGASTDVYVTNNVMTSCGAGGVPTNVNCGSGMIHASPGSSFLFIQGNTLTKAGNTVAPYGVGMDLGDPSGNGDHYLVENNDLSHYDIGIKYNNQYGVYRNNTFHDQLDSEGCENTHTDEFFSEPGTMATVVQYNLFEGNYQRNAVGPNAKTMLMQSDNMGATCPSCSYAIVRFNTVSGLGSGAASNYYWPHIMNYNNTVVDALTSGASNGTADYAQFSPNGSYINNIYEFHFSSSQSNWNVYQCGSGCNFGYNLYFCATSNCSSVWGNTPAVPFLSDTGNKSADPKFVTYAGFGSTSNDYHLQAGSPAIAAGINLTTVAAGDSGSGTALVVNDASYFQDGFGLTNANSTVNGDCIAVNTASNHVCVTAVNYSTNTLTLASGITRSSGQPVYLYSKSDGVQVLTSSAPNIGAYGLSSAQANSPAGVLQSNVSSPGITTH